MPVAGVLNLAKPAGWSSRAAVDRVQFLVRPAKAGHAGTLDPLAEGVLVVCVGSATRLIEYVQRLPKRYRATFLLGRSSVSDDTESEVIELSAPPVPSPDAVTAALRCFTGEILQRPPAFSALKVDGRRAYELARRGRHVELAPRSVTIHHLSVAEYDYPRLVLDIECSSGTYVRSLGRDLAEKLGTSAVMSALTRTAIGPFELAAALRADRLTPESLRAALQPPRAAVAELPTIEVDPAEQRLLLDGRPIHRVAAAAESPAAPEHEWAALDAAGRLVALVARRADGQLWPTRCFPCAENAG